MRPHYFHKVTPDRSQGDLGFKLRWELLALLAYGQLRSKGVTQSLENYHDYKANRL